METQQTIFRVAKDRNNPYCMIDKRILSDTNLSWKAKGILVYLLSKPDDWQVRMYDLVRQSTDGLDGVQAGIRELIDAGYVTRERQRGDKGRLSTVLYYVHEKPPQRDFPRVDNPRVENPPLLINESTNDDGGKNIFKLFEQTWGIVSPVLVDELKDYEARHTQEQLVYAFHAAASAGAHWRYARAVLDNGTFERSTKKEYRNQERIREEEEERPATNDYEIVWKIVKDELSPGMNGTWRDKYLTPTRSAGWSDQGKLIVVAPSGTACQWLQDRVGALARRSLAGIMNKQIDIEFVSDV